MMPAFKYKWNRIAVRIAAISFFLGTLLMLTALMAQNDTITGLGIAFLILYIPITLIVLFILFVNTMANLKDILEHTITVIIVLMNFPIGFLYLYFINS